MAVEGAVAEIDDRGPQFQPVESNGLPDPVVADSPTSLGDGPDHLADQLDEQVGATVGVGGTDRTQSSRRGRFRRWAPILGGARRSVLDQVPLEADRFTDLLPLLVAVAMVSGISMAFAIATGVLPGEPAAWYVAIPVALLWMALIFLVDRALTASMKSTRSARRLLAVFIPRILIAAVIGAVVSGPLVLQVFARDIQQEMLNDNLTQGTQQSGQLDAGPEKQRLDRAAEELKNLQDQAATGKIPGVESESQATRDARERVTTLEGQVEDQQKEYEKRQKIYACSVNATAPDVPGCVRGADISKQRLRDDRDRAGDTLSALQEELAQTRSTLAAAEGADKERAAPEAERNREDAKAHLPAAEAEYKSALADYTAKSEAITTTNDEAVGLIAQIRALERLQSRDQMVRVLHWLVAALFFLVELMPVLVKTFRSWGDPNPYELAETATTTSAAARRRFEQAVLDDQLAHDRQRLSDQLEHQLEDERLHREARAAATLAVEQDMLDREISIGREQNARVAARMETVVGRALDEWEREVDRLLAATPAPLLPPVASTEGQAGWAPGGRL